MEITVKHEFTMSPELEAFFKSIYGAIHLPVSEHEKAVAYSKAPDKKKFLADEVKAEQKLTVEMSAPFMEKETATDTTVEQLRAVVSEKASAKTDNRAKIKQLLTSFGAENVTSLDKDNYADFLNLVNSL